MRISKDHAAKTTSQDRKDRGALLVEFALIAPLLIMFIMGSISMGLGYNRSISLNNSAREAARYAATLPVAGDLNGWLTSVADVAVYAAAGDMNAGAPGQALCVAYVFPDGTGAHDRTLALFESSGSRSILANATCFDDGRPSDERRVQVSLRRETEVVTGVVTSTNDIDARSVVRFERAG